MATNDRLRSSLRVVSAAAARARARAISAVEYAIFLDLSSPSRDRFKGRIAVSFALDETALRKHGHLSIDFRSGTASRVTLNGRAVKRHHCTAGAKAIRLAAEAFSQRPRGRTVLSLDFESAFSGPREARGLTRWIDPVDDTIYVATSARPFALSDLLPCFDQRDLPATFSLRVKAPRSWHVIAATPCAKKVTQRTSTLWEFETSVPYAPYLFPLVAGPYDVWVGPLCPGGTKPLKLYARRSLKQNPQWGDYGFVVYDPTDG